MKDVVIIIILYIMIIGNGDSTLYIGRINDRYTENRTVQL